MLFLHAMEGLFSIILMVALGYLLTRKSWFVPENSGLLSRMVNYIALPSYMVWNLLSTFDKTSFLALIHGILIPVASMLISYGIGFVFAKILKLPQNRSGIFRSVFFCSSSVFIGVPVNLALFGETSLPYVLIYFLANASLFWTVGNYSISLSGSKAPAKLISMETLKHVCSPPFMGFAFAVLLIVSEIHLPKFIMDTAKYLGGMTTPLSMLIIGITMIGIRLRDIRLSKDILAALIGRFVVSPAVLLLVAHFIPIPELMKKVFVIQASLPAMSHNTVLAKVYEADAEYASLLVSLTTLLAVLVIPVYMVAV